MACLIGILKLIGILINGVLWLFNRDPQINRDPEKWLIMVV